MIEILKYMKQKIAARRRRSPLKLYVYVKRGGWVGRAGPVWPTRVGRARGDQQEQQQEQEQEQANIAARPPPTRAGIT